MQGHRTTANVDQSTYYAKVIADNEITRVEKNIGNRVTSIETIMTDLQSDINGMKLESGTKAESDNNLATFQNI